MQIYFVGLICLWSRLAFNTGPLGPPTSRGEIETKPGRNLLKKTKVHRFRLGNRSYQSAIQARFMRNETIMTFFLPGFSSTPVHPGNNPWKVHVSFLPIFHVSTSSLVPGTKGYYRGHSSIINQFKNTKNKNKEQAKEKEQNFRNTSCIPALRIAWWRTFTYPPTPHRS